MTNFEETLSPEDYKRYGKMYQYFQKIVALYESEPNNFARLQELFQDMQECGQPPVELIKELAPGLDFGPDGMPIMPNMSKYPNDIAKKNKCKNDVLQLQAGGPALSCSWN